MRSIVCCLFLVFLVIRPAEARRLTEDNFLSTLNVDHPALISLERELGQAQARERAASALANPDLRLEREAWGELAQQSTMTLSWAPPLLSGRGARRDAARAGVTEAEFRVAGLRLRLRSQARASYAAWWDAKERVQVLTRQSALVATLVEGIRNRAATGEESGLTARRFELANLRIQAGLAHAEVDGFRAAAGIQSWYETWDPTWEPARPDLPGSPDSLSWETRPEVQALQAGVEDAEFAGKSAGQFLAFPSLEFGWVWLEGDDSGVDGPWAGLVWNVPLFDRNQPARTRAESELRSARGDLEVEKRNAKAGLFAATRVYDTVHTAALGAWNSAADLDLLTDAAVASFRAGESTDTDLLEILRSVLETKLSAIQLYSEGLRAHRALEEAAGKPLTAGDSQ